MPTTTTKGFPVPLGADNNDTVGAVTNLANFLDAMPGITIMDTTTRNALSGATRWTGRVIFNTTTTYVEFWDGAAWVQLMKYPATTTWTPQIDQGVTNITKTVGEARYAIHGNVCHFWMTVTLTAGGTTSNELVFSLPVAAVGHTFNGVGGNVPVSLVGYANVQQASGPVMWQSQLHLQSLTKAKFRYGSNVNFWGVAPAIAVVSGDSIMASGTYTIA